MPILETGSWSETLMLEVKSQVSFLVRPSFSGSPRCSWIEVIHSRASLLCFRAGLDIALKGRAIILTALY
jgi:hypothetical protein